MLKKTSIYLDEELDQSLARKAAEEGITKAELIRRSLEGVVAKPKRPKPKGIGIIKGGPPDLGRNAEKYLYETGFGEG
ncbi:MAG: CopG family transcriptional regulator [Conexibacter sp.]|nr:CopG family transcriptional regulator [Conexibacter sp.]